MTVVEWANEGLEIASKSGKSIDELIGFLRMAYAMKMLFDNAKPEKKGEDGKLDKEQAGD